MRQLLALIVASTVVCGCEKAPIQDALLITNVTVITPGDSPSAPTDVLIADGRIQEIGESVTSTVKRTLDGTDKYLVPGLIDGHTHLNGIPGMRFEQEAKFPDIAAKARQQIPRSYLYYGFTTVVDLNSVPEVIAAWNDVPVGPRAWFCGAAPVFDGYPTSFMPKPARYRFVPYFLYDENRADEFPGDYDPADHSPKAVVERIHNDGGICVKTHYENGFGERRDLPVPTQALIAELTDAAHSRGIPVLLHANSEEAQAFGVNADIDAFAHGMWTWNDRSLTELHAGIRDIVDAAIESDIALQPTIQVLYGELDLHDPGYLDDPRLRDAVPQSLIDWYASDDGQWFAKRMLEIPAVAEMLADGKWKDHDLPPIARVSAALRYFADNGGILLFGSDTPSAPTFANPPGLNGRIEMDRWIEASIDPRLLFEAATINNARFFGLDEEIGTVKVGKQADLLLLRENPLESVAAWDTIETVILAGEPVERSTLSARNPAK